MVLLSCSAPKVLWVLDTLTSPILGDEFLRQLAVTERESGYRIKTVPYAFREKDRLALEELLTEDTYSYVVVSPYVALELEALEIRFPGVTFLCMDAPEGFFLHPNVRGITFDPAPALKEALKRWEQYRSSTIPKDQKLLILSEEDLSLFRELGFGEPSPGVRTVLIPKYDSEETIRKNLRKELAEPVDLLVVWAGKAGSIVLELLSGPGTRRNMGIIGQNIERFPRIKEYPFIVSLRKDYAGALSQVLTTGSSMPSRFPYSIFPP